ncbi:hypothetical protein [Sporosarcina sp. ZBG7A]|nr:hypothetical protein [Sporosarcina sp. ZBG7A]
MRETIGNIRELIGIGEQFNAVKELIGGASLVWEWAISLRSEESAR